MVVGDAVRHGGNVCRPAIWAPPRPRK
jgi:hypothetical protein